jgi:outer membrane protein assembly factor BamB
MIHIPATLPQRSKRLVGPRAACARLSSLIVVSTSVVLASLAVSTVRAGDWPQILGPQRNGEGQNESLLAEWPEDGPVVEWTYPLGSGYAGPAVADGKAIVFHRQGDQEVVEAIDAKTGKSLWKTSFPANYRGGIDSNLGPRCVPLVDDGKVFAFGADGDLHCVDLASGAKRWSRSLYEAFKADRGYFGAGSTPIVVDGVLLVNVGGRGAGLVGLNPASGKTLWQKTDEDASYSSPTEININGRPQAIFVTRYNALIVDPKTGETHAPTPFGKRGPTVNAATPLVIGNDLFLTASYGVGALKARIDKAGVTQTWANDDSLSSQYSTPVVYKGHLYGTHGREDVGVASLRCVELATGKVKWSEDGFGVAHPILGGDKIVLQSVDGRITLIAANPSRYEELATGTIAREPTRALPALSEGRLFVRTTPDSGGKLHCLRVGK